MCADEMRTSLIYVVHSSAVISSLFSSVSHTYFDFDVVSAPMLDVKHLHQSELVLLTSSCLLVLY